jgi:hypothetical protein
VCVWERESERESESTRARARERERERKPESERASEREKERERPRMRLNAKSLVSSILSIRTVDLNSLLLLSPTTFVSCRRLNLHSSPCIGIHQVIYMYTHVYIHKNTYTQLHHATSTGQERGCRVMPDNDKKRWITFIMSRNSLFPNSPCSLRCLPCHNTPQVSRSANNVSSRASGSSHELVQVRDRMCPLSSMGIRMAYSTGMQYMLEI